MSLNVVILQPWYLFQQGIWSSNGTTMVIQPFNSNATSLQLPHVIIKYEIRENNRRSFKNTLKFIKNKKWITEMRERQSKNFRFFPEGNIGHFDALKNFLKSVFFLSTDQYYYQSPHRNYNQITHFECSMVWFYFRGIF